MDEPEPRVIPEVTSATVVCPECGQIVRIQDIHAFLLSQHQRVCVELTLVNGES